MKRSTLAIAAAGIVALGLGGVLAVSAEEGWRGGPRGYHGGPGDGQGWGSRMRAHAMPAEHRMPGGAHFTILFDALDIDANDEVSRQEALRPASQRFARLDGDGDGFVDKSEVGASLEAEPGRFGEGLLERLDADGDGQVSAAEFGVRGRAMFARADANDDGVVSFAEFAILRDGRHHGDDGRDGRHGMGPRSMMDDAETMTGSGDDD
jgi:hypothetical protein